MQVRTVAGAAAALLLLWPAPEGVAEVQWHPYPPGTEIKSLPFPREPRQFVLTAYRRLLGREPESGEMDGWLSQLDRSKKKREGMVLELMNSDEFFVRQCFVALLGREPGARERAVRLEHLRQGGERRDVVRNILASPEYREHLGNGDR